jgi:RNA polymerase sigma-70 factor (ECF subfamily)
MGLQKSMSDQRIIDAGASLDPGNNRLMVADELIPRLRRLDMNALAQVHDLHFPEVYRYVRFRLSDELVSEDIAAEVFMRLLEALHRGIGPTRSVRAWLFATASNLINDHLRLRYAHPIQDIEEETDLTAPDDPVKAVEHNWQTNEVQKAMQKLTSEQQHVLALRFAEEMSIEETAAQMNRTINAVKVLQFRAIVSLRRHLEVSP